MDEIEKVGFIRSNESLNFPEYHYFLYKEKKKEIYFIVSMIKDEYELSLIEIYGDDEEGEGVFLTKVSNINKIKEKLELCKKIYEDEK